MSCISKSMKNIVAAEENYLNSIYSANFPNTVKYAYCLHSMGTLYADMKNAGTAEEYCLKATSLYSAQFPDDINYTDCLYDYGLLLKNSGRKAEASQILKPPSKCASTTSLQTRWRTASHSSSNCASHLASF